MNSNYKINFELAEVSQLLFIYCKVKLKKLLKNLHFLKYYILY